MLMFSCYDRDECTQCDVITGPVGVKNECISLSRPYYDGRQWATCVTKRYATERLGGGGNYSYLSNNCSANYCWLPCMLEAFDSLGPSVEDVCRCSPSDETIRNNGTLPPSCYDPDGSSCDWYSNCLEAKYPCRGTGAGYAIEFGMKYCRLFERKLLRFSALGQQWLIAVKKCLQVSLVPLLWRHTRPTCMEIRRTAFLSHVSCWLHPSQGVPSICSLPPSDKVSLVLILWRTLVAPETAGELWRDALKVVSGCLHARDLFAGTRLGRIRASNRSRLPETTFRSKPVTQRNRPRS